MSSQNQSRCTELAREFKLLLVQLPGTLPGSASPAVRAELAVAREGLECLVLLAVHARDEDAFQRGMTMLRPCAASCRAAGVAPSPQEGLMTALYLLFLLVEQRTAEFHMELELLSHAALEDPHVVYAAQIERWIMEGVYTKVIGLTHPHNAALNWFTQMLETTMREDVAGCLEHAYAHLTVEEARELLLLKSAAEVLAIGKERGWTLRDGVFYFARRRTTTKEAIPAHEIISNAISYTSELERVV
jgi:26S proteasome regulatory subunit N12